MARQAYSAGMIQPGTFVINAAAGQALAAFTAYTLSTIRIPCNMKIIGVSLMVGRRGGTHVNSALDVQVGGVSILSSTFDVDALTPATIIDKELSALVAGAASVTKDALLTVVTTESGGTSPTWGDVTIQIDYIPIGS